MSRESESEVNEMENPNDQGDAAVGGQNNINSNFGMFPSQSSELIFFNS